MGHAIRIMMNNWAAELPPLNGVIEMDEKFIGGKPRHRYGVRHKGGLKGGEKVRRVAVEKCNS